MVIVTITCNKRLLSMGRNRFKKAFRKCVSSELFITENDYPYCFLRMAILYKAYYCVHFMWSCYCSFQKIEECCSLNTLVEFIISLVYHFQMPFVLEHPCGLPSWATHVGITQWYSNRLPPHDGRPLLLPQSKYLWNLLGLSTFGCHLWWKCEMYISIVLTIILIIVFNMIDRMSS